MKTQNEETFYIQRLAAGHVSCCRPEPVREVQKHINRIGDEECCAWYVKTEDGKLHGQFHQECVAIQFAREYPAQKSQ